MLTFFPPTVTTKFSWRKPLIGIIFSLFCIIGGLATISPNQCGRLLNRKKVNVGLESTESGFHYKRIFLRGHHPTCGNYKGHLLRIRNRTFCAACVGLLSGALLALAMTIGYFFLDWNVIDYTPITVFLGILGVSFGLLEFKFQSFVRLLSNTIFVLGSLLVLIGMDKLVQSLFFDLFTVSLIAFWLFTRISLSQFDHKKICSCCDIKKCKIREEKEKKRS
jgi:hypothetical protein